MIDNCGRHICYFTAADLTDLGVAVDEETGALDARRSPAVFGEDDCVVVLERAGVFWRFLLEAGPEEDGTYRAVEVEPIQATVFRDRMYNRGES